MVVKIYANNTVKTRRDIEKSKKKSDLDQLKALIYKRNEEMVAFFGGAIENGMSYIKNYKKEHLISMKQISFDPFNWQETWEVKEKDLLFILVIGRDMSSLGIEVIYINSIQMEYKGIVSHVGGNTYSELGISTGYDQTKKFFKLLTDYSKNISIKKVKK